MLRSAYSRKTYRRMRLLRLEGAVMGGAVGFILGVLTERLT